MTDFSRRPPEGRGRRGVSRSPGRESVPATGTRDFDLPDDEDWDDGSAGVREPRRPMPLGPMSDAGALPIPEPPMLITLPDPRQ